MVVYEIKIYGRVQGTGFRKKIKKFCDNLNLNGSVENLSNGSAIVFLECDEISFGKFNNFLKSGKGLIKVNNFEFKKIDYSENFSGFKIKKRQNFLIDQIQSFVNLFKYFFGVGYVRNYLLKIPSHVAIIPDGNRRWARRLGMNPSEGHKKSAQEESYKPLLVEAEKLGIKYLSLWLFSTENWKRSEEEKKVLFDLLLNSFENLKENFHKNKIRFRHLGRKDRLPRELLDKLNLLEKETKNYSVFNIQFLIDYGGRDEILRAVNNIIKKEKKIDEEGFKRYLDTKNVPDPDFIIRTSGEKRLSGLMPYQGVYSELYFTRKHFPCFKPRDLRKAVMSFGKRERRFGGK
ncbi:MAG: polyprenyl diphosphate synthase [archaeon]